MQTINERDKKVLKFGAIAIAVILVWFLMIGPWFSDWGNIRKELAVEKQKLKKVSASSGDKVASVKQSGLFSLVPVFEMPASSKEQTQKFRAEFNEQLKKSGLKVASLQLLKEQKLKDTSNYRMYPLRFQGKGNFNQVLDLLAGLNRNPFLLGVEEIRLTGDKKDRKTLEIDMVVSTLTKN